MAFRPSRLIQEFNKLSLWYILMRTNIVRTGRWKDDLGNRRNMPLNVNFINQNISPTYMILNNTQRAGHTQTALRQCWICYNLEWCSMKKIDNFYFWANNVIYIFEKLSECHSFPRIQLQHGTEQVFHSIAKWPISTIISCHVSMPMHYLLRKSIIDRRWQFINVVDLTIRSSFKCNGISLVL